MLVFVKNKYCEPLMPCKPRKARLLLKENKAKIISYNPFTIQLLYGSSGYTQETNLGIDTGAKYIGIAITCNNNILFKIEIKLRQDVKQLLETRKIYRRNRRNRKTRYRKAKFLNRTSNKKEGWLPPSIQSRINNTVRWIEKFYLLLPRCNLNIEVGKFDIQKLDNPIIEGEEYQKGNMYGYRNRIAYLIAREGCKCQYCHKGYEKGNGWRLHHIWGKHKDRPQDWALLHEKCHVGLHQNHKEKILQKIKSKSYKESVFMNIIRRRLFQIFPSANFTYGNITFQDRCDLGLVKTHYNDAIAISGIKKIDKDCNDVLVVKQFRKKKRSLHEATPRKGRKLPNILAKRNSKNTPQSNGFFLNDKVSVFGKIGWISGFTNGGCYVKNIEGEYITMPNKNYTQVSFSNIKTLRHNNNWIWQFISPPIEVEDFLPIAC